MIDLLILSSFSCSWINLNKHPWIVTRTDHIGWLECTLRDDARICNFLTRDRTCQSHPLLYKNPSPTKNLFVFLPPSRSLLIRFFDHFRLVMLRISSRAKKIKGEMFKILEKLKNIGFGARSKIKIWSK